MLSDTPSTRQELAATLGTRKGAGDQQATKFPGPWGMHKVQCCASVKGAALVSPPRAVFCFFSQTGEAQLLGEPFCLVLTSSHE